MPPDSFWGAIAHTIMHASPNAWGFALLLPILFRHADRFYGADDRKFQAKVILIAAIPLMWAIAGLAGVAILLGWWVYRSLDFKGGAGAPENELELLKAKRRHTIVAPLILPGALLYNFTTVADLTAIQCVIIAQTAIIFIVLLRYAYAPYAFGLAKEYGKIVLKTKLAGATMLERDYNKQVEYKRGMAFGFVIALAILGSEALNFLTHFLAA